MRFARGPSSSKLQALQEKRSGVRYRHEIPSCRTATSTADGLYLELWDKAGSQSMEVSWFFTKKKTQLSDAGQCKRVTRKKGKQSDLRNAAAGSGLARVSCPSVLAFAASLALHLDVIEGAHAFVNCGGRSRETIERLGGERQDKTRELHQTSSRSVLQR